MNCKNFSFPDLQEKVHVVKSNPFYRVSDVVLHKGPTWRLAASRILENAEQYGESLLYSYLLSNGIDSELNIPLLNSILCSSRFKEIYSKPSATDLVVHLRLGDMLEPGHPIGPERIASYANHLLFKLRVGASKGQLDGFNRLVVCTAIIYGGYDGAYDYSLISEVNSRQLLSNIFFEVQNLGLSVDVHSSADVDADIYFMWSARHLVLSNSEFSTLIAKCACTHKLTSIYTFAYEKFIKDREAGKIIYNSMDKLIAEKKFFQSQ